MQQHTSAVYAMHSNTEQVYFVPFSPSHCSHRLSSPSTSHMWCTYIFSCLLIAKAYLKQDNQAMKILSRQLSVSSCLPDLIAINVHQLKGKNYWNYFAMC